MTTNDSHGHVVEIEFDADNGLITRWGPPNEDGSRSGTVFEVETGRVLPRHESSTLDFLDNPDDDAI